MNQHTNIILADPSSIIYEGLASILGKSRMKNRLLNARSFEELEFLIAKNNCELVIINPSLIQNNEKPFHLVRTRFSRTKWIGLVYSYFDHNLLSLFDSVITISDTAEMIGSSIQGQLSGPERKASNPEVALSEREIEVLKLLTSGMANKEIADKLNISVNTVITHRKNITQKTGIKSVSGLTIFAVVQKLITIDPRQE